MGRGTGAAVGLGTPVGTGNSPGGDPEPTGKGGVTPVGSGLEMLIGDAAAKAERPARSIAVAYMLRIVDVFVEVGVLLTFMIGLWVAIVVLVLDLMS